MDAAQNRKSRNENVMYVYDRVCPKQSKKSEIRRTYGRVPPKNHTGGSIQNEERIYGKAFARSQINRAHEAGFAVGRKEAYQYRPASSAGGEAVKTPHFKLVIEKIVNFFDSVEEKGRHDQAIARRRAIAWKKFYEYKHIFLTALLMLAVTAAAAALIYNIFFVVENVEVSGSDMYSYDEILLSSGIEIGDNLYSFAGDDTGDAITFLCPYIKSADIDRTIPTSVAITLEEDTAAYYAVIWGDCVLLSEGLRVLDVVDKASITAEDGLTELVLPPVKYSVAGRVIEFAEKRDERFVRDVLAEVSASSLRAEGMIDEIDLSDEYNITIESCGRYLLKLGDEKDCDLKLKMGYKTMVSDQFDDLLPARIDLSEVCRAVIRPDASLDLSD